MASFTLEKEMLENIGCPCVYVFYKADTPLYVGYSTFGLQRVLQHRKRSRWWKEFTHIEMSYFDSTKTAREQEERTILALNPVYNIDKSFIFNKKNFQNA